MFRLCLFRYIHHQLQTTGHYVDLDLLADPDDLDRAIELLHSARDRGYFLFGELARNTDLDVLRSLPGFQAIANEA